MSQRKGKKGAKRNLDELESQGKLPAPNLSAMDGDIEVLEWWYVKKGILPNWTAANLASKGGKLESLKWMAAKGIFPRSAAPGVYSGNLEVVEWLYQHDIRPERCREACLKNDIPMMKWLVEKGVLPTNQELAFCCRKGYLGLLRCLSEKGILPDYKGANQALLHDRNEVLDWLLEKRVRPGGYIVLECLNSVEKLQKLESLGLVLTQADATYCKDRATPEVLAWVAQRGYCNF